MNISVLILHYFLFSFNIFWMDFLEKNCKNKKTKWIAGEFLGIFYLSTNLTSYKELRNVYLEFFLCFLEPTWCNLFLCIRRNLIILNYSSFHNNCFYCSTNTYIIFSSSVSLGNFIANYYDLHKFIKYFG